MNMNAFVTTGFRMAGYVCRSCGTVCNNKGAYVRCPVCGIKWS